MKKKDFSYINWDELKAFYSTHSTNQTRLTYKIFKPKNELLRFLAEHGVVPHTEKEDRQFALEAYKESCYNNWGTQFYLQSDDAYNYRWNVNGCDEDKKSEIMGKIIVSLKNRTDEQREESHTKLKKTLKEKYGEDADNVFQLKEIKDKSNLTKQLNCSWNKSEPEDALYVYLVNKFGEQDVCRQYNKDDRYPFHCDFYIKSIDLFIEYNGFWTHGGHLFNEHDKNDIEILMGWENKLANGSLFYKNAINNWLYTDPLKYSYIKFLNHIWEYNIEGIKEKINDYAI